MFIAQTPIVDRLYFIFKCTKAKILIESTDAQDLLILLKIVLFQQQYNVLLQKKQNFHHSLPSFNEFKYAKG